MRVGSDLQSKALLALEEVCAECRFGKPRRTHAVRFALAYLWSQSNGPAETFIAFWQELDGWNKLHRWRLADAALNEIYRAVGASVAGRDEISSEMWRQAQARHESASADQSGVRKLRNR